MFPSTFLEEVTLCSISEQNLTLSQGLGRSSKDGLFTQSWDLPSMLICSFLCFNLIYLGYPRMGST